ncbi:hypothetical protein P4O66_019380, partial [Electrophorus voltai]
MVLQQCWYGSGGRQTAEQTMHQRQAQAEGHGCSGEETAMGQTYMLTAVEDFEFLQRERPRGDLPLRLLGGALQPRWQVNGRNLGFSPASWRFRLLHQPALFVVLVEHIGTPRPWPNSLRPPPPKKFPGVFPSNTGVGADVSPVKSRGREKLVVLFCLPEDIISNRGPQFTSWVWKKLLGKLNITVSLTSGYHPQANGQVKKANQELADRRRGVTPQYEMGQKMWVTTKDGQAGPTGKLSAKYKGPYAITGKVNNVTYKVGLPGSSRASQKFHVSALKPVVEGPLAEESSHSEPPPPPLEIEGGPQDRAHHIAGNDQTDPREAGTLPFSLAWGGFPSGRFLGCLVLGGHRAMPHGVCMTHQEEDWRGPPKVPEGEFLWGAPRVAGLRRTVRGDCTYGTRADMCPRASEGPKDMFTAPARHIMSHRCIGLTRERQALCLSPSLVEVSKVARLVRGGHRVLC